MYLYLLMCLAAANCRGSYTRSHAHAPSQSATHASIVPAPVPYEHLTLFVPAPAGVVPSVPLPWTPPMAGRLIDFRTSRVASRRGPLESFPAPDALRHPRPWSWSWGLGLGPVSCSGPHMHMLALRLACFQARAKLAARQSGELRGAIQSRPGPMPQSVLVPARRGSKGPTMERQMEQPGLSFRGAATHPECCAFGCAVLY
ncbi:hypothetical protein V8C26DRAFT_385984 [Trichoderma gracile]